MTLNIQQTTGYAPDYDMKCFVDGEAGEQIVMQYLTDSANGGTFTVEVKTDRRAAETGNVFIELTAKGKKSGILTTKAKWFTILAGENMYTYRADTFREFVRDRANACSFADDLRQDNCRITGCVKDPKNQSIGLVYKLDWLDADYRAYQRARKA